jgi:sialate O-acetylesterase
MCLFFALISMPLHAQFKLPKLVSDNMVLQRDQPITLWGWGAAKDKVVLKIDKQSFQSIVGLDGKWQIQMPPQPATSSKDFLFSYYKGKEKKPQEFAVKNVAFGDVWLCSGQSNMVLNMERVKEKYAADIASANYADIRNFFIATLTELSGPKDDFPQGEWRIANTKDVLTFGAVTYYFAKELYDIYKVPIGIINSSVGGTPIEAWISEEGFKGYDDIQKTILKNKDTSYVNSFNRRPAPSSTAPNTPRARPQDQGEVEHWEAESYVPKGWRNINIPGYWEDQGLKDLNGIVWYRKEIEVPASWLGKSIKLYMGRIVDADEMYVNGKKIGNITYQYPPRRYEIPADLLHAGKNVFVIRVTNTAGKGGFVPDKPYYMTDGKDEIDLKGTWQYKIGQVNQPFNFVGGGGGLNRQNQPNALYNAMIAPILTHKVKGFLWYQGESNTGRPEAYDGYMKAIIQDWRSKWKNQNLPFLGVQLCNFQDINFTPSESGWARLREAQNKALELPNTAVTVTIDLGEWNDIHPLNKKDIGKRLALSARKFAYGDKSVIHSGPSLTNAAIVQNKIVLTFDNVGEGITADDGEELRWFAIADYDKKFQWAKVKITGKNTLEVWHDRIATPKYVRYAWQDNPEDVNFYNSAGLPASPFRTDGEVVEEEKPWKGKKCAVALTYDDGLHVHLDNVVPVLDSFALKGTFFITAGSEAGRKRIVDWRRAAANGHELANHTLNHPCIGFGRAWVKPHYDLGKYPLERIQDEIKMCNAYLESIDGKKKRTFAYTCGDKKSAEVEFMPTLKEDIFSARGVVGQLQSIDEIDPYNVNSFSIDGDVKSEDLIALVDKAKAEGKLLVFLFHGVGGEHNLNVALGPHSKLIKYLKENEKDIYIDTFMGITEHIQNYKMKK